MTVLMIVWEDGVLIGQCDEICYDDLEGGCECVCGGENHGVGLEQAELNSAISGEEWLRELIEEAELDPAVVTSRILDLEAYPALVV